MDLEETRRMDVDLTNAAQDMDQWLDLANTSMILKVPQKERNFSISWAPGSFS
jgi:hypothetical protein